MVAAEIIAAVLSLIGMALFTLVGIAYRNLRNRVKSLEDEGDENAAERRSLRQKVNTLWRWAFGREDDETDAGLAKDIESGFERIEEDIEHLEKKQETYHSTEMSQFERLVNLLHDDDDVEIDRDDVLHYDEDE